MIANNPVHAVCNYGSSAQYKCLPSDAQIASGVIPLDSLPAAWWNCLWFDTNGAVNEARSAIGTLITEVCNAITGAGISINESCVDQLYQAIDTIRQRIGNAVTAGAVKSSLNCGEVSIDANGIMTANGVGNAAQLNTTCKEVVGAINELKTTYDDCFTAVGNCLTSLDTNKAPINHASSATTYGVGNADCYGHLKISDVYTSCVGSAADGIAASQLSVYCLYQELQGMSFDVACCARCVCVCGTIGSGYLLAACHSYTPDGYDYLKRTGAYYDSGTCTLCAGTISTAANLLYAQIDLRCFIQTPNVWCDWSCMKICTCYTGDSTSAGGDLWVKQYANQEGALFAHEECGNPQVNFFYTLPSSKEMQDVCSCICMYPQWANCGAPNYFLLFRFRSM